MSEFYTNVQVSRNNVLICGYKDGKRFRNREQYKPYLFVASNDKSEYKTLNNKFAKKIDFDTISEAREFYKTYSVVKNFEICGLDKFVYTYIYDNYPGEIKYNSKLIRVFNLDIEVQSNDGFPDINLAAKPVTLIGIGIGKERFIFGCGEYYPKTDNIHYVRCADERDLLQKFLSFWSNPDSGPDVVTGWNIEKFDLPYLVNRIKRICNDEEVKRLSPWGILKDKVIESRGKEYTIFLPVGISILDYYDLYRKFTYTQLESYTLDHVAFIEVGKRKLDYSEYENLNELYLKDYSKFVDYNITDIDRVADIDEKNKFIELVYAMSYDAKINFNDALTSVLLWDIICHNYLMDKKIVIPKFEIREHEELPGAYVKSPIIGMHEWVVSFDLTSLYPHLIMQYNISPETFVERIPNVNAEYYLENTASPLCVENNWTQAANGCRYTKTKRGFLAELMKSQFTQRVEYKNKMIAAKKEAEKNKTVELENDIARYNNFQMAKKIQLNSAYGAIANRWFRYYNINHASAITISGQLSTMWIERKMNEYINKVLATDNVDYIIAADTDSIYVNMSGFIKIGFGNYIPDKTKALNFLDAIAKQKIEPFMKKCYDELAMRMNAYENAMSMKREALADKAIWKAKKMYILNVHDNEGIRYNEPKLKMMGIEAVRSSTPAACRDNIKNALTVIMNSDEDSLIKFVEEFKKQFFSLPFEDIAFPRGVNGLTKYTDSVLLYKKGTPIHVKASLVYNNIIKTKKMDNKFPLIFDRDKVKFCYLKTPNPSRSPVIASPKVLPKELELDVFIDYETQFDKSFLEPIRSIVDAIGWKVERKSTLDNFFE